MSVSNCYKAYVEITDTYIESGRLRSIYNRFDDLTNDNDRIRFISKLPEVITTDIPQVPVNTHKYLPNYQLDKLNRDAEDAYNSGDFSKALHSYTKSLSCFSGKKKQEQLYLGYSNRSKLLLKMGQPEACIRDVDRALKHTTPKESNKSCLLLLRKAKCHQLMGNFIKCSEVLNFCRSKIDMYDKQYPTILKSINTIHKEIKDVKKLDKSERTDGASTKRRTKVPELSFPKSAKYTSAINQLTVKYSEDKGRYLTATEDIPIGK